MNERALFLEGVRSGRSINLTTLPLDVWPEFEALRRTPQDFQWHAEGNVLTHTEMVLKECLEVTIDNPGTLLLSALFHDIAKPETTRFDESINHTIAPGHERIGGIRSRYLLRELGDSLSNQERREISQLVATHHLVKRTVKKFEENDPEAVPFLERLASRVNTKILWALELADMRGRICVERPRQIEIVELFRMLCEERNVFGKPPTSWLNEQSTSEFNFQSQEAMTYAMRETHRRRLTGEIKNEYQARAFCHEVARTRKQVPHVIFTIGVSGSGKSYSFAEFADSHERISTDAQRLIKYGNEARQGKHGPIYQACTEQLIIVLRNGGGAYFDATNIVPDLRSKLVSLCHAYGALVSFHVFDVSLETAKRRNKERDRKVPEVVIEKQASKFEWPFPEEYHLIEVIDG